MKMIVEIKKKHTGSDYFREVHFLDYSSELSEEQWILLLDLKNNGTS